MGALRRSVKWERVLIDVCTQRDYLDAGSILQVSNLEELTPNLRKIFRWARSMRTPVVSIVESHRPSEPFNGFPLHCIEGTPGHEKMPFSLLSPWNIVENDNYLSLPPDLMKNYRQLIFRKRSKEILSNPKTDRFLTNAKARELIVYGVGLDRAIKPLVLGLLARHKTVTVVQDACGYWSAGDAELVCRQISAKGIRLTTTEELIAVAEPVRTTTRRRSLSSRHHPTGSSRRSGNRVKS